MSLSTQRVWKRSTKSPEFGKEEQSHPELPEELSGTVPGADGDGAFPDLRWHRQLKTRQKPRVEGDVPGQSWNIPSPEQHCLTQVGPKIFGDTALFSSHPDLFSGGSAPALFAPQGLIKIKLEVSVRLPR